MSKGSRNRTSDYKRYREAEYWKQPRKDSMLDYPGHLMLMKSNGHKLTTAEQAIVDKEVAWWKQHTKETDKNAKA